MIKPYQLIILLLVTIYTISCGGSEVSSTSPNNNISSTYKERNTGRDSWQKPELVIESMGNISDKTVIDIGAGTGYFTFRLAFDAKKVIAADIDPDMISLIETFRSNLPSHLKEKIETRMVKPEDPMLSNGEADVAVIINTIGYINKPIEYLSLLQEVLSDDGQVVIVDFKKKYIEIDAPPLADRVSAIDIERYLIEAGFSQVTINEERLDYQYLVTGIKTSTKVQ